MTGRPACTTLADLLQNLIPVACASSVWLGTCMRVSTRAHVRVRARWGYAVVVGGGWGWLSPVLIGNQASSNHDLTHPSFTVKASMISPGRALKPVRSAVQSGLRRGSEGRIATHQHRE